MSGASPADRPSRLRRGAHRCPQQHLLPFHKLVDQCQWGSCLRGGRNRRKGRIYIFPAGSKSISAKTAGSSHIRSLSVSGSVRHRSLVVVLPLHRIYQRCQRDSIPFEMLLSDKLMPVSVRSRSLNYRKYLQTTHFFGIKVLELVSRHVFGHGEHTHFTCHRRSDHLFQRVLCMETELA